MGTANPPKREPRGNLRALAGSLVQLHPAGGGGKGAILARLVAADAETVVLMHPGQSLESLQIETGQPVVARLYTGGEILQFRSTVLSAPSAASHRTRLAYPASISYLMARRANRIPIRLPATSVGRDGTEKAVLLLDFSENGCHATSATPLGLRGAALRLEFMVQTAPSQQTHAVVNGRIRWMSEIAAGAGWHFAHGIELDSSWAQRRLLEQLVTCFRLSTACGHPLADGEDGTPETGLAPAPEPEVAAPAEDQPARLRIQSAV